MAPSPPPLRLSEKDQEKLNSAILNDFLLLVERVTYCGTRFELSGSIEQTFTSQMSSNDKSLFLGGGEKHIVHRDELDKWIGMLKWELEQLPNCNIIFAMGNYALEAILGSTGVTNWRGSVIDAKLPNGRRGRVVCAFNPAYAQRELKFEPVFRMDCKKLDLVNRNVFRPHRVES